MNQPIEQKALSKAIFISDLHLQQSCPKTAHAFLDFLRNQVLRTKHLYILGDLFEYWVGDDDMDSDFLETILAAIKKVSDSGVSVFWISGNRDFLTGENFLKTCGAIALPELYVADFESQKVILAHGDAQCTDDKAYIQFRNMVRAPLWQKQFLSMPLPQRKAIIESFRQDSKKGNQEKSTQIMDVNESAIADLFKQNSASIMIHGHTHRPDRHTYNTDKGECVRLVLSDWNFDGAITRGGWIEIADNDEIIQHTL